MSGQRTHLEPPPFGLVAFLRRFVRHRASLQDYDGPLLDQLISAIAGATILAYAIYTLWPETVEKFGTHALEVDPVLAQPAHPRPPWTALM